MSDNAGPLLVRAGLVTEAQLHVAYEARKRHGGSVGEHLVATGAVDEERLASFFRDRLLVPRVGLAEIARVEPHVVARVPAEMAAEFRCLPVEIDRQDNLFLAMIDPSDTHAVDEIGFFIGAQVLRCVAPPSAIAWGLERYYGIRLPHLAPRTSAPPHGVRRKAPEIVEDVYGEDTPIPEPFPLQDTGTVQRIIPETLRADQPVLVPQPKKQRAKTLPGNGVPAVEPAPQAVPESIPNLFSGPVAMPPSVEADGALEAAVAALEVAQDRDAVADALVEYLAKICQRAAFFVVRKGMLCGWIGRGLFIKNALLREATLPLDRSSTFRDIIRTRLPFRGPVTDPASRDLLVEALGWAPTDMLAVPIAVRDKVVGVLYGDERQVPLPDEHLGAIARAAEAALQRAVAAKKSF